MPIANWKCGNCCGRTVPLDHFATTVCGETVHPDYAAAVLHSRNSHYAKGVVEVSHTLSCPRRYAIEQTEGYALDPVTNNAALTGEAWHSIMEDGCADEMEVEVELSGVIDGIPIIGRVDRLRRPLIEDWKHISDFALKHKTEVALEHRCQLSIYAELCEQDLGWRPERGIIWYHTSMGGDKALKPMKVDLMPIAEVLEQKPLSGEYTVRELLHQAHSFFAEGKPWKELAMSGATMFFGTKRMCDYYCGVRDVCMDVPF